MKRISRSHQRDPNENNYVHRPNIRCSKEEHEQAVLNAPSNAHRKSFIVENTENLLDFLLHKLSGQSHTTIKNILKHRCVLLNHAQIITQFNYPLNPGDHVSILSQNEAKYGLFHPLLQIIYEDDFIIVVEKQCGLLSVDLTGAGASNACDILNAYVRKRDAQKRIFVVHRLDRDTSGVMVFAKCREAQNKFVANWNDRVLERTYIAVCEGIPAPSEDTLDSYMYQDEQMIVHNTNDPEKGLRAITHYKTLKTGKNFSLIQLELETGRTNQIRVHFQSIGHPLAGDDKYGATSNPIGRLALHARTIRFHHPITQKILYFEIPQPHTFLETVESM